jgi:hypothetical protein
MKMSEESKTAETSDSAATQHTPAADATKPFGGLVDYSIHVKSPNLSAATDKLIAEFRSELEAEPILINNQYCRDFVTDQLLHQYLRARSNDLKKAKKLLLGTLEWRLATKPDEIPLSKIEPQQKTGKMLINGLDRHKRPVWVMDSSKGKGSNKDHDTAIAQLLYLLEFAKRKMSGGVEKYCLFIHLENYSMFNAPPMKTSMETLRCLTDRYVEHLGHAVMYQAPYLFQMFFKTVKPFLDPKTVSKIVFIRGDCKPGSENDKILTNIIGEDWRSKARVDSDEYKIPAYNHEEEWPKMMEEEKQHREQLAAKQQNVNQAAEISTENNLNNNVSNANYVESTAAEQSKEGQIAAETTTQPTETNA